MSPQNRQVNEDMLSQTARTAISLTGDISEIPSFAAAIGERDAKAPQILDDVV